MMRKSLFLFLVIATTAFKSSAAAEFPGKRSCSDIQNCGKCLNKSKFGCVWHVSDTFEGSCVESHQCDSLDGECFEGQDGNKKYNKLVCGDTCGIQTGCTECLAFDAMGKKKRQTENSDCAWFVKNGEAKCIGSKRCREKANRIGSCIVGKPQDDEENSNQCAAEPKLLTLDKCEQKDSCHRCLNNDNCAWYTNGKTARCISEPRCDDRGFEGGTCTKGATTFDTKKTCGIISGAIPDPYFETKPLPIPEDPDIEFKPLPEDPGIELPPIKPKPDDEVGIEKCSDFDGLCTDCLNMGCSWINSGEICVDSCKEAPADVGCSALPKQDNRKLLRFEDEASRMCYDFKLEDKNMDLCQKAAGEGCKRCVTTQLFTPPGMVYIEPPTCKWFPETDTCYPFGGGLMGIGTDKCEEPPIVIDDPIIIDDPVVKPEPDDRDEVGIEKCSDFDGLCTDCLNMGCSWINANKGCVNSCKEAPADVGCSALPKQDNRKLLRFEDEASRMCYDFKLEDKNMDLCQKAAGEGCKRCVTTQLFTPPGMVYIEPPTCKWFPETDTCYPFGGGLMGIGTDKCEEPPIVIDDPIVIVDPKPEDPIVKPKPEDPIDIYKPMPSADMTWPKLVGESFEEAKDFLSGTYGPTLEIEKITTGMMFTEDYVLTRVRLHVDRKDIVVEIPKIG